jgi:hypothetical protein
MSLTLDVAIALFPGLVGLGIYRASRDRKPVRTDVFRELVLTLAFASFGHLAVYVCWGGTADQALSTVNTPMFGWKLVVALFFISLGAPFVAAAANHEWLLAGLRYFGVANRGSEMPAAWDKAFHEYKGRFVRVRLKDGSVLGGEWKWASYESERPQLFVMNAEWKKTCGASESSVIHGPGVLIPSLDEVLAVDFLDPVSEEATEND